MSTTSSPLPPLYDRWMQQCLPGAIPPEPRATCHDCAMCAAEDAGPSREAVFFDPLVKCCSYMPTLWNFLVGSLLEDDSAEAAAGRRTVEARIDAGVAVTPLGLATPPAYQQLYARILGAFGQTRSMRCPHFIEEGALCGVWRARESTCATWFCKHERGAVGEEFWSQLHRLLTLAERGLGRWCLLQLDVGEEALRALLPLPRAAAAEMMTAADFDNRADPQAYRRKWGRWVGKEREFYRRAGELAREIPWSQVRELGGAEAQIAEVLVQQAFRRLLSTDLPGRLRAGSFQLTPDPGGGAVVTSYSGSDPLRLNEAVLEVLPFFDGQPVTVALQAIRESRGVEVTPDLVRKLVDFGVLEDAG